MSINMNTNMSALTTYRNLTQTAKEKDQANERLSSGKKINSASDDASGLAISESLEAQIASLGKAVNNIADTSNMLQVAEGALSNISDMSLRMQELTMQASNATTSSFDKSIISNEISSLVSEMNSTASRTEFNEKTLLDGSVSDANIQIGSSTDQNMSVTIDEFSIDPSTASALTENTTELDFAQSLDDIAWISNNTVSSRASIGATQNGLSYTSSVITQARENLASANSNIKDADMAEEVMNYTSKKALQDVQTTLLAQANQSAMNTTRLLMM
ncbi:MAG: flagellin [bacterium]